MKRILIFSVAYYPVVGGAEVAVKEITDRISDIEFNMITLNLDGTQQKVEQIGNVMVYRIGGKGRIYKLLFPFLACIKASKLHRKKQYDAIWSIMASFGGFAALFFKWLYPKVVFVLTLQEGDPIKYIKRQVWFVYPLFQQIFRKAQKIQTISTYLAQFAHDMGAQAPVEVIPNGVDTHIFSESISEEKKQELEHLFERESNQRYIITTSRLVTKNAVDDIIRSLQLLPQSTKLLILGIGPDERMLRQLCRELNVAERVIFVGFVPYKDIPAYLAISDVFVRPSRSEGMGNSFIEAMAAGVPVVATPVGGIPDFLKHRVTGLFCEVNNPKSVAERIREFLDNDDLRTKIIDNSKKMVLEHYDWNLIATSMRTRIFID